MSCRFALAASLFAAASAGGISSACSEKTLNDVKHIIVI